MRGWNTMYNTLPEKSIVESKILKILSELDSTYDKNGKDRDKERTRMILMDDYLLAAYTGGAIARGGMFETIKVDVHMKDENSFHLWPLEVIQKMITYSLITELRNLRFESENHKEVDFLITNLIDQAQSKCFPIWAGGLVRAKNLKFEDILKDWADLFGLSLSEMEDVVDKVNGWTKDKWTTIYVNEN